MCGNRAVINIKPKPNSVPRYLFFVLRHLRPTIETLAEGSVQKNLYVSVLSNLDVPAPPKELQQAIADILGVLDDRITLLRETNNTLEAVAQALFKSWFVDFDPVHAKMQGRAPEGMIETTAALFPDSFEESELGAVPKGWATISFRDSINVIGGGTPKTSVPEYWAGDIPWFSVVDAPSASDVFVVDTEKHITEAGLNGSSTKLLPTGTTIISARGTVGRLALTGCPMAMNQSCYGLRGKAGDQYFTYFSTTRLVAQLQQRAHGSVFDTITQETFAGVSLCYPAKEVMQAFEQLVEPLLMRIRESLIQANSLASLRDALLPRLMSGQLLLSPVEDQVNA
jgi:type I restriction enzyme S subunit